MTEVDIQLPFINNLEVELFLKREFQESKEHNYKESYVKTLLSWLHTAPKFTTFRVNTLLTTGNEVCEKLKCHLHKQAINRGLHVVHDVEVHPVLSDVVVIASQDETDLQPTEKEIIVDAVCGAAVLRGAHVFAPGVMGMPTGVRCGDFVSVYADIAGHCRKGFQKRYTNDARIFLGNGIICMERKHLYAKDLKPVGVAIEMIETVSGCPAIEADCLSASLVLLQNLPSILCCHVLNPQKNETVLDMCAAPGNKTSHLAMLMENQGIIIALDKTESKMKNIIKRCQQFSLTCVHTFACDSTKIIKKIDPNESQMLRTSVTCGPPFEPASFDRILLDAPCSALGQRPQLANKITLGQLKSYPSLQRKLFKTAVSLLKPGGTLVYSTCTVTASENERLVHWALKSFADIELMPALPMLGGPGLEETGLNEDQRLCVQRFGPPLVGNNCDRDTVGFFIAHFRKKIMDDIT